MNKISKIILIVLVIGFLFSLPITPVQVVPEVTLKVVNADKQPVADATVYQDWQHWTFESQAHRDQTVSDTNGFVTFSEKSINVSILKFLFWTFFKNTLGIIMIHASFGPHSHFIATKDFQNKKYWGDIYTCYGSCKEDAPREIIVKGEMR